MHADREAMIVADTHVHIYPCYRVEDVWRNAAKNLAALCDQNGKGNGDHTSILFLAERRDCNYFKQLVDSGNAGNGFEVGRYDEDGVVVIRGNGIGELLVIAGRQIVTKERLEVLCLTLDMEIADGSPIEDVLGSIVDQGGIAVLPWSPGKWFFERSKVIERLIASCPAGTFLIGDVAMRAGIWGEPRLMHEAKEQGISCVAGSDPLPFPGEEQKVGIYGIAMSGEFDYERPVISVRRMLRNEGRGITLVGQRDGLWSMIRRNVKARWGI